MTIWAVPSPRSPFPPGQAAGRAPRGCFPGPGLCSYHACLTHFLLLWSPSSLPLTLPPSFLTFVFSVEPPLLGLTSLRGGRGAGEGRRGPRGEPEGRPQHSPVPGGPPRPALGRRAASTPRSAGRRRRGRRRLGQPWRRGRRSCWAPRRRLRDGRRDKPVRAAASRLGRPRCRWRAGPWSCRSHPGSGRLFRESQESRWGLRPLGRAGLRAGVRFAGAKPTLSLPG